MKTTCRVLIIALFILLVNIRFNNLYANTGEDAESYLKKQIHSILAILQQPEWQNPAGQKKLYPEVRTIIREMFDFNAVSAQVVGQKWKDFSQDEQTQFTSAFTDLLEYSYSNSFRGYKGQTIEFEKKRENASGTQVEITTNLVGNEGKKTPMIYRLRNENGSWKVYNIIVENINLIISYRTQIETMLTNSSPSVAIEKLQEQVKKLSTVKDNKNV